MIQKLDKNGNTSIDNANVVILDKNGNVKKIAAASGTVTSILTASPITGGPITSSGTIGIPQANTSTDGYLSSTDWNTFNGKFTLPSLTSGSVLFSNGTTIAQDNANFFWDDTNKKLNVGGTASVVANFTSNTAAARININNTNASHNAGISFLSNNTKKWSLASYNSTGDFTFYNESFGNYAFSIKGSNSNVLINTTTDNGGKLQIKAPGALSTDIALRVRNSADTGDLFGTQGDGTSFVDSASDNASLIFKNGGNERFRIKQNSATLQFSGAVGGVSIGGYSFTAQLNSDGRNNASLMSINPPTINFSSGTNLYRPLSLNYTINTTGGTNTVTGLRIEGTLTSLTGTTHRAIETVTGDVILGSTSGNVGIGTTAPAHPLHTYKSGTGGYIASFNSGASLYANASVTIKSITSSLAGIQGLNAGAGAVGAVGINAQGGNVLIGTSTDNGGIVQIKAPGALSTDIALRVRNSANTGDFMSIDGTGATFMGGRLVMNSNVIYPGGNNGNTIMRFSGQNYQIYNNNTGAALQLNGNGSVQIGPNNGTNWATFSATGHIIYGTTNTKFFSNGNVAIGTVTDIASSKLTVESTTQGFLPPRMTNAQRLAIATPAIGLMVYCTDVTEGLYINKSTGWTFII